MTLPLMTITRFAMLAWNWMDQGAPDVDPQPDLFLRRHSPDDRDEPVLTDLEVAADLSWIDNFNWVGSRYHY